MASRVFTGVMPDGVPVLVTVFDDPEAGPDTPSVGEVAFKRDGAWGIPTEVLEELS